MPAGTKPQRPSLPPVSVAEQPRHAPEQASLQQTSSAQKPDTQSSDCSQEAPFTFFSAPRHVPEGRSHSRPAVQSAFDTHLALHITAVAQIRFPAHAAGGRVMHAPVPLQRGVGEYVCPEQAETPQALLAG